MGNWDLDSWDELKSAAEAFALDTTILIVNCMLAFTCSGGYGDLTVAEKVQAQAACHPASTPPTISSWVGQREVKLSWS